MGCGFQSFCNRPIISLPPKFPEACLRRLEGLKGLFFAFSYFCYSSLSSGFSFRRFLSFTGVLRLAFSSSASFGYRLYLFFEMAKKKSCQNVRNPHVLSPAKRELYGWVDPEVFTQPFVLASEHLPELHREMRLAQDLASERDYVLEAAGPSDWLPSDWLPFRALEDRTHFLWVYVELFTRLGVRLPFSDFQREVLTRCQVAASQLHLNGWGFLRTFERVCLHFGFRPSLRIFLYTYQLHAPPPGNDFLSFRAYHGRRLFDAFEESIQEFKWHYFKVLPLPGTRPFWVDDEGSPYPWVY
ncbi:hypothetical protein PIB30_089910 [Stylosanthes scabra]|uniref:Transposase (putative) gypsy type domain-containing protein n=1 Tax=Stylosanthes scabra TaxID=79078 RepID=A0ABU6RUV6_9FABA|nr:hypothetical protein [Stylosanthes scabra]